MAWKRYRTPDGAHVSLNWQPKGYELIKGEDALDVNGRPKPPVYPQPISKPKPQEPEPTPKETTK